MTTGADQRQQLRFPVGREEGASGLIDLAPSSKQVEIADLSLGGASLIVPQPEILNGARRFQLGLRWPHWSGETSVELVHVRRAVNGSAPQVGVRFRDQREHFLRNLCSYLVHTHSQTAHMPRLADPQIFRPITEGPRVHSVLRHLCRSAARMRLRDTTGSLIGSFYPTEQSNGSLTGDISLLPGRALRRGAACFLVAPSFISLYLIPIEVCQLEGRRAKLSQTGSLLRGAARAHARITTTRFPVWIEFVHPQVPGKLVRKVAREIGFRGLSFPLTVAEDLLAAGTVLDSAVIRLPDGRSLNCRGVIRHTYRDPTAGYTCGVELLDFVSGSGRGEWVRTLQELMYPQVTEAGSEDIGPSWGVLERSGYLEEKPPGHMAALRQEYEDCWSELVRERKNARLSIYRTRRSSGPQVPSVGTAAVSRIYRNTWLAHHLAIDRGEDPEARILAAADLSAHSAFQWLVAAEPGSNLLLYLDKDKSFNKIAWFDFFTRHESAPNVATQPAQLLEYRLASLSQLPMPLFPVREATEQELRLVAEDLRAREGSFVCSGLDLTAATLRLAGLAKSLGRQRAIFVVPNDGAIAAYALVECGRVAANIFTLYNTCRFVVLRPDLLAQNAQPENALFGAAVEWYRQRGSPSFLVLCGPHDTTPSVAPADFSAAAVRSLIGPAAIPLLMDHLDHVLANR